MIVFGIGRFGSALAHGLCDSGQRVLAVDFDPEAVREARGHGFEVIYGDATDPEFLAHLPIAGATWVVSALPHHQTGLSHVSAFETLTRALSEMGYRGGVAATALSPRALEEYRNAGADIVFHPYRDGARYAVLSLLGTGNTEEEN